MREKIVGSLYSSISTALVGGISNYVPPELIKISCCASLYLNLSTCGYFALDALLEVTRQLLEVLYLLKEGQVKGL